MLCQLKLVFQHRHKYSQYEIETPLKGLVIPDQKKEKNAVIGSDNTYVDTLLV